MWMTVVGVLSRCGVPDVVGLQCFFDSLLYLGLDSGG